MNYVKNGDDEIIPIIKSEIDKMHYFVEDIKNDSVKEKIH